MADEVGIVMKLYDEVSPTLKSITGSSKAFDKTMDDLEESLKAYDKAQTTLTEKMSGLKKGMAENSIKVKEAQQAYKKLKDETSKGALDDAIDRADQAAPGDGGDKGRHRRQRHGLQEPLQGGHLGGLR